MHVSSRRPFLALLGMVLLPSSGGKACSPAASRPAQQAALASAPGNASAAATAFMAACKRPWNFVVARLRRTVRLLVRLDVHLSET